eukprot:10377308-Ditylum_brightwellii.AAC.1
MGNRQKSREDSILSHCLKMQLKPIVSSFEEDGVTQVIDSALSVKDEGLNLASSRCRGLLCHFCGLSDVALGTPLVRVPNQKEWEDILPHAVKRRTTRMVAELDEDTIGTLEITQHETDSDAASHNGPGIKEEDANMHEGLEKTDTTLEGMKTA